MLGLVLGIAAVAFATHRIAAGKAGEDAAEVDEFADVPKPDIP